jgi:hypothetical protein
MRTIISIFLSLAVSFAANGQDNFTEYRETIPAFGLCLMPNNLTFLSLEADYDGMYFTEHELADLFEVSRFNYNDDLTNWTYYDYWILNNRGAEVPREKIYYNLVVDPTGEYVAVNVKSAKEYNTEISIYNLKNQSLVAVVDIFEHDEAVEHISFMKFDLESEHLLVGSEAHGTFLIEVDEGTVSKLETEENLQLVDYDYTDGAMYFAPISVDEYNTIKFGDGFIKKSGNIMEKTGTFLPVHDYTRVYSPLEMNKTFTPFYRQSYDTYITNADSELQTILYRSLETFQIITYEKKISLK